MTIEYLVNTYGYLAILFGTFLEGETVLVLGGIAAKLGYLNLLWVIVCAFIGTLFGDQIYFFLGRYRGKEFLEKRTAWKRRANKVHEILERNKYVVIIGFRFMYGLRTVMPFMIGMSRIPTIEFLLLNITGALIWAIVIGVLGFAFGHGVELILGDIRHYEKLVLLSVIAIGVLIWVVYLIRTKREINEE